MKKIFIINFLLIYVALDSCSPTEKTNTSSENTKQTTEEERISKWEGSEIEKFPMLFSYATDSLKEALYEKCKKPLSEKEKASFLDIESVPREFRDNAFQVYATGKISFQKSTLVVYVARQIEKYSDNHDQIMLVMYNDKDEATDIISKTLQDNYSSTYEINFISKNELEIINTDHEYSPDPESEAEDIKTGRVIEPSVMTEYYKIDTLQLKFVPVQR